MRSECLAVAVVLGAACLLWPLAAGQRLARGEGGAPGRGDAAAPVIGRSFADFTLRDITDQSRSLSDYSDKRCLVVAIIGTECPISNLYLPILMELQEAYRPRGVQVVLINANRADTLAKVVLHARKYNLTLPVLRDPELRVAGLLGARRMAEVFLLDSERIVRYHGRIDDRFGYTYKRDEPRRRDLEEALKEVLAGGKVAVAETEPTGCLLSRAEKPRGEEVTYSKQVSRILQNRCQECHHPGTAAPFSLLTHEDAVSWADTIKEVLLDGRMPPWYADPRHGKFLNDRRLREEELDALLTWIDSGAPPGDPKDLPEPRQFAEGWVIGKPDVVFELPEEVSVQATGVVPYLYFTTPTNFKEDVWIEAAEARPGNRRVVHHIIVSYRDPKLKDGEQGRGFGSGTIVGTAPGDMPLILPPGVARKIPAGAELVWQMHYTPTGKVEKDRSQVGLIFYKQKEPPKWNAMSRGAFNTSFSIPPGHASYRIESETSFQHDAVLLSFMPHMHLRGKSFEYQAMYPDGRSETLLSVPRYDFNWQLTYRLAEPLHLPRGTKIHCIAHFDNSSGNPANPDPTKTVTWGDQTWEEMMIGWMNYYWEQPAAEIVDEGFGLF